MKTKLSESALRYKESIEGEDWEKVKSKIKEVSNSLSHEDLKLVSNPLLEHPVWQLNIDETGHRVYIDVKDGEIVVIAIFGSKFTHSGDRHWEKIENRIKDRNYWFYASSTCEAR
ncbi:MAG: hypothetical protein ABEJ56_02205 [Candidatus Nanohaloarchaea archaeon]